MIYRAIIEKVVDRYTAKIRIPLIHRTSQSVEYTPIEKLPEAKICTLPSTHANIKVGDIVLIAFENSDMTKPVIIGYLYKESFNDTAISPTLNSLKVQLDTKLSRDTYIGEVSPDEISSLIGVKENIQQQINQLTNKLNTIRDELNSLKNM